MDEKPDKIIEHIGAQREQLGRNLNELETRVRRGTNWRTYFEKNPMAVLGAALGGGILLGSVVASGRRSRSHRSHRPHMSAGQTGLAASAAGLASSVASSVKTRRPSGPATSAQKAKINETMDHFKAALIAFGISKAKEFMSELIPGFDEHLGSVEQSRQEHRSTVSSSSTSPYSAAYGREEFRSHTDPSRRPETVGAQERL